MHEMAADYPHEMRGWYHGAEARNIVQRIFQVLSDSALDLAWSVVNIMDARASATTNNIVTR